MAIIYHASLNARCDTIRSHHKALRLLGENEHQACITVRIKQQRTLYHGHDHCNYDENMHF